jgi:acetylxylan esterase
MYVYVPDTEPTDTQAIIVAIHSCERTAEYYFENTGYASLADEHGYIVIYPNSSTPSGCWDVSCSTKAPTFPTKALERVKLIVDI